MNKRVMITFGLAMLTLAALGLTAGCSAVKNIPGLNEFASNLNSTWGKPTPAQAARDALNPYDTDRRRRGISLLSAATFGGEDVYVRMYRNAAADADPTVRAACIRALGIHGTPEDAQHLIKAIGDREAFVRWEAATGLQKIHHEDAIAPLTRVLGEDPSADVRASAAVALGQYPMSSVLDTLIIALDDTDFSVVAASHRSLAILTGYDFGTDSALWLIWAKRHPGETFIHQRQYTWKPYKAPPGFFDRIQIWKKPASSPQPRVPTGLDEHDGMEMGSKS
jgi:hypothetical protein